MSNNLVPWAQVPAFKCPPGTKMHLLNLGILQVDEGWLLRGGNSSSMSNKNPENKRRDLVVLAALIEHPDMGLILFETGCAEDLEVAWGAPLTDVFPRTEYTEEMKLPAAIKATGNDIKDVKAIVIGHLHLDHAGGLEHFMGTDIPIYVHEEEFKHACWAVGTGADLGVYLGTYMDLTKLKWNTFTDDHFDLCQGITIHYSPGHTPGLCIMQVNLEKDGTYIWTTDQYHIAENHDLAHPHGWLAEDNHSEDVILTPLSMIQRDHNAWVASHKMIQRLERQFKATLIFGHDKDTYDKLIQTKKVFE